MLKFVKTSIILCISLLFVFSTGFAYCDHDVRKKNVLVLMSYSRTNDWTESVMQGILKVAQGREDIELFIEYMDTKRFLDPEAYGVFGDYLRYKYYNVDFDAILAADNNALNFVVLNRERQFEDIPVVFCGINNYSDDLLRGQQGICGYSEDIDIPGTIDLILRLFPKTKHLYAISDNTVSGQADLVSLSKSSFSYEGRLECRLLVNYTADDLRQALAKLPPDSVVLPLSFHRDRNGVSFHISETMELITQSTSCPVFTLRSSGICSGVLGGKVVSGYQQGYDAAKLLINVLNGKKFVDGAVNEKSPNVYMFDHGQLIKFGIKPSQLPEGSVIVNPHYSFYEKYTLYIWGSVFVIAIETFLILGLIANIRWRKRGQRRLLASENKFRSYIENAPDGIFISDVQGNYIEVNKFACSMTGYSQDELMGMNLLELIDEAYVAAAQAHFQRVVSNGHASGIIKFHTKQGQKKWWSVDAVKLGDDRFLAFCRDVTEAKREEVALINARKQELHVGFEIQNQLLLGETPEKLRGASVAACSIPSDCIDGDFYDFVQYDSEHFDLILGDVMGKGVSAALCGAATKAQFLRAIYELTCSSTLVTLPTLEEIATFAHHQMYRGLVNIESFVTACIARFNLKKMRMDIVDCGHPATIHYRQDTGTCELIKGKNFPIGFSEHDSYEQMSVHFKPGDILFFYSDGVLETKGHGDKIFGMKRIENFIKDYSYMSPDQLTHAISDELKHFSNNHFSDDITYIIVKLEQVAKPKLVRSTELSVSSEYHNIEKLRDMISTNLGMLSDVNDRFCLELNLAISEAFTNIIKHGYDGLPDYTINVKLDIYHKHVEVLLKHEGKAMEKRQFATPAFDGSHDNGYGLYLIRNCVDEIKLDTADRFTTMTLVKFFDSSSHGQGRMKRF